MKAHESGIGVLRMRIFPGEAANAPKCAVVSALLVAMLVNAPDSMSIGDNT